MFFDEVQNLDAWAPQIKNLVDNHAVRLLVTGSSSFDIEPMREADLGGLDVDLFRQGLPTSPSVSPAVLLGHRRSPEVQLAWLRLLELGPSAVPTVFGLFSIGTRWLSDAQEHDTPWPELATLNETWSSPPFSTTCGWVRVGRSDETLEEVFRLPAVRGQTPGQVSSYRRSSNARGISAGTAF